ncbi:DUF6130 family protein [Roseiarcus sp.]|uniref:DUF6130 family protein n=1 Tax=Roseiarcus sp. TaxID=1969460 RepID=UPI003C753A21
MTPEAADSSSGARAMVSAPNAGPQTARDVRGPAAVIPLASEPPAKIVVDPPLPDALARGLVVIQYRTENLRIVPVFGPGALDVSPRIGKLTYYERWIAAFANILFQKQILTPEALARKMDEVAQRHLAPSSE